MARDGWVAVDDEPDPGRLVVGLDRVNADPQFRDQRERVLSLLEPRRHEVVVDVGCGTGEDVAELSRRGCRALGVERSRTMLAEARRRHPGQPMVAADAHRLPLPSSSVDAVTAVRVVQHLDPRDRALAEWRRVLRPAGRVVTCDPDLTTAVIEGVDGAAAAAVCRWRAADRAGTDAVASLEHALAAAGFVDVSVEEVGLELRDLGRADGIMGLAGWGGHAADAGILDTGSAGRWADDVDAAWRAGRLRYACTFRIGRARAP